ncbi:MAG: isoprenylcysteine carboxylmethyltransferase family protein [Pseudomonadota bacterium]
MLRLPDRRSIRRVVIALGAGGLCHSLFALGGGSMVWSMYFGLSESFGTVPWPWALLSNAALVLQFPLAHSLLLTPAGQRLLAAVVPSPFGKPLATTTYATIAAIQLALLFLLWTPSGIVWWRAEGAALLFMTGLYASTWLLLSIAVINSGWQLQSGALGWLALVRDRAPRFPDLPQTGLYRLVRHPIYLAFALTLWTVPTWTPDQFALAIAFTAYCVLAPMHKESRLLKIHGDRFAAYRRRVPYWLPFRLKDRNNVC